MDSEDVQRAAWNSLFEELGLMPERGRTFLTGIAAWWQGDEKRFIGSLAPSVEYIVLKEPEGDRGLIIFTVGEKRMIAYVGFKHPSSLILHAYMAPEEAGSEKRDVTNT